MTSNKGTENRKAEKGSRKKTPRVLIDVSAFPHDDKGNAIVPDDYMEANYRNLPNGTRNESGTRRAQGGGMLHMLGEDPERDRDIQRKGGEALQATLKQRRTLAESIEIALRKKASKDIIKTLGLEEGATNQDAITAAIILQASAGNTKAYTALRDTVGEMPVSKQQISADITTEADRALMEKITKRLQEKDK